MADEPIMPDIDSSESKGSTFSLRHWAGVMVRSRYFFIAVLLHVILLLTVGAWIIIPMPSIREDLKATFIQPERDSAVRPPTFHPPVDPYMSQNTLQNLNMPKPILYREDSSSEAVIPPQPPLTISLPFGTLTSKFNDTDHGDSFSKPNTNPWRGPSGYPGIFDPKGNRTKVTLQNIRTKPIRFRCYVVQYAGGDWDSNMGRVADGRWYGNCMYNLMLQVQRWTSDRVKAELVPTALQLSESDWIQTVRPPFIFMSGHKDFKFTDTEVQNLKDYLMLGGALWVDNSLPGHRSRFDQALRREMKRVLPDCNFESINSAHPIFRTEFAFKTIPTGMNRYREPVEIIKIGRHVSVVYTLNAYSDLWETGLDEKNSPDVLVDWSPTLQQHFNRLGPHWKTNSRTSYHFFQNVNQHSVLDAYRFGVNILFYLLTRFDENAFPTLGHNQDGESYL